MLGKPNLHLSQNGYGDDEDDDDGMFRDVQGMIKDVRGMFMVMVIL